MEHQHAYALKREGPVEVVPASEPGNLSDEAAEHFKSLCQELSATILEQHGKALQHHGAVRMSFEFPHSAIDTVVLTIRDNTLTIGRCVKHRQDGFAGAAFV